MPARPRQMLRAVLSRRWSWYHWNDGTLGAAVLDAVEGVGALAAGRDQQVVARLAIAREAGSDVAVGDFGWFAVRPPGWPSSSEGL